MDREPELLARARRAAVAQLLGEVPRAAPSGAAGSLVGIGIGPKLVAGRPVEEASVRLYVARKLPSAAVAPGERLPDRLGELRTDVVEIGAVLARPARAALARGGR